MRAVHFCRLFQVGALFWVLTVAAGAQEFASLAGTVRDSQGQAVAGATVTAASSLQGFTRESVTDVNGRYTFAQLPPGAYEVRTAADALSSRPQKVRLEVGATAEVNFTLVVSAEPLTVNVADATTEIETQPSPTATVIDEHAIQNLPLNGRRFSDLGLLSPEVQPDPRGLTSGSNGDLAFGGVRGLQSTYLVDGADNNNAFFAQARGRYRAPYQFSNEVVQEFRVSSNTYGAEYGRSSGAVVNVVTKSGTNHLRGSLFDYYRDGRVNARHRFLSFKPPDKQHQFGGTIGGPIRRNKAFFFAGFDQHIFHVPTAVRFLDGSSAVTATPDDYETRDRALVEAAAAQISGMAAGYQTALIGNAFLLRSDWYLSSRHSLSARISTSRYSGDNNVFFDPGSPVTTSAQSDNGEERVATESFVATLTSGLTYRSVNTLRFSASRDLQESSANSEEARARITDLLEGMGRSTILPRRTRELRFGFAESVSWTGSRHAIRGGVDLSTTRIQNFFPLLFGGQFTFSSVRVNPFTFAPQTFGLELTPLRAYAHAVPRFYSQNFGDAESRPSTNEYAAFVQDTVRITGQLALNFGLRYDWQTFARDRLVENPLWPSSGWLPEDRNNLAPRAGFAFSSGEVRPFVLRGGYGLFYTRIPSIYASAVETENGINRKHLSLNVADFFDRQVFPAFPDALTACSSRATRCEAPASVQDMLTTEIASFDRHRFQTPYVQQANLSAEKELANRFAVGASYTYTHGSHLIRARDANLPQPVIVEYPVFSEGGSTFEEQFLRVPSYVTWQFTRTFDCPFPPCLNTLARPIPEVGAINVFETVASSVYHGLTLSARRRMSDGLYFRFGYTLGHAIDDNQDALVAGRPATVENAASPAERGRSVTDQRHRFVFAWIAESRLFGRDRPVARALFNRWRFSGVTTAGSGRPVSARVIGDANQDGNSGNDRLPGASRNAFTGPDYFTLDLRLGRQIRITERWRLELLVESFNVVNRTNYRVRTTDDGFADSAAEFVQLDRMVQGSHYPAHYRRRPTFLQPQDAYAPRQVQFAAKLTF